METTDAPAPGRRFVTPVRGHAFAARPPTAIELDDGRSATLVRERTNPVDRWAVAVWVDDPGGTSWRIGYLDRTVAARVGPRLDDGGVLAARLAGWTTDPDGRWRRPLVEVSEVSPPPPPRLWGRPPGVVRRTVAGS